MQRQHPIAHAADFNVQTENVLLLPNDLIGVEDWYKGNFDGENNDLQRIVLIDLKTFDKVATLLSSPPCQISNMAYFSEKYLAILYDEERNSFLGIWDIDKILKGDLKPNVVLEGRQGFGGFLKGLPNGELAVRESFNRNIDFYNSQGHKTASLSAERAFYSYDISTVLGKSLIYLSEDAYQNMQVNIIDFKSKKKVSSFCLPLTRNSGYIKNIISLSELNAIAMNFSFFQKKNKLFDYFHPNLDGIEIWDLTSQKCVKQIRPCSNDFSMTALPNGDIVTLTREGVLEFWDKHAKKQEHIQLPKAFWMSVFLLHHCGLILLNINKLSYIPLPERYLEKNKQILDFAEDIVTRPYFVPEVKQIMGNYLGFFAPKELQTKRNVSNVLESKKFIQ